MIFPFFSSLALKLFIPLRLAAVSFFPAPESGQPQKTTPPIQHEIVVTATRLETPAREVASSVTVLTRADLDREHRTTLYDALQDAPGLAFVRNGGPGEASSVFLRGTNSAHTLVLLDGIPLNDPINPSRAFDFAHFTLDGVERIEILRGPQSPLYGSDAIGGVIQIITARGQGRPRLSLQAAGGSLRNLEAGLNLGGSSGVFHYGFGLSRTSTEGISAASADYLGNFESDSYRNLTLSGRMGASFQGGAEIDLVFRGVSARTEIDNFGGPFGDDPNHVQDYASLLARIQGRFLLSGGRWEQKAGLSFIRSNRRNDNPADSTHPFDSERGHFQSSLARLDWQNHLFLHPSHTLTGGADLEWEIGESEYVSESQWGPYESVFPRQGSGRAGLYVQDQVRIDGRFFATAGFRFDHHSRAGDALTWRIAPAFIVDGTGTKIKATFATGFKAPSLYQLYAPGTMWGPIGNAALAPERCLGWDAGLEQSFGRGQATAGLTYFHSGLKNLIDFDFAQGYLNIGRARTSGLEAFGEARPDENLVLRLSYTRLEARDLVRDTPLPRRPKDKLAAAVQWAIAKRWDGGLSAVYTGPRTDRDYVSWPARDVRLDGFTLLGAHLAYSLRPGLQAFLRLDNILKAKYETVYGYGSLGFTVLAGLRLQ